MRATRYDTLTETLPDGTKIWVSAEPEDLTVEQEAKAIGGGAHGARFAKTVRQMVRDWGRWGWCCIKVTAIRGKKVGVSYLGACSYESAEDFRKGGYYEQKRDEAVAELA